MVDLRGTKIFFLFEARSAFRAVQCSCERHQNVPMLFLLDNLVLVLLLTKGRVRSFLVLAVIRRIYGIAHRANCCLVFRWAPSEVDYSDRGSRFYDADCDLSECLLSRLRALQQQSLSSRAPHQASSSSFVSTSPCHHMAASLVNPVDHCFTAESPLLLCRKNPVCLFSNTSLMFQKHPSLV